MAPATAQHKPAHPGQLWEPLQPSHPRPARVRASSWLAVLRLAVSWLAVSGLTLALTIQAGCATQFAVVRPGGPTLRTLADPEGQGWEPSRRSPLALGERSALAAIDDDAALDADHGGDDLPYRPGRTLTTSDRMAQRCRQYRGTLERAAARRGLDPLLLLAVAWVESGFNPAVESPVGAAGIMQMLPSTARSLGCSDNIDTSCQADAAANYLIRLMNRYQGDVLYALCAYNSGPVAATRALHRGELPSNVGFATRVLEARSRLERFGCDGK